MASIPEVVAAASRPSESSTKIDSDSPPIPETLPPQSPASQTANQSISTEASSGAAELEGTRPKTESRKPKPKWTEGDLDRLVNLKKEGTSWTSIAKQLDNGKTSVACRKMYAKIMKGQELWTPELDSRLKDLYREEREVMWLKIAEKLSMDWHDVETRVATLSLNTVKNG